MADGWEIRRGGREDLPGLEEVWRSLHAHHSEISAAAIPFCSADGRWPSRLAEFQGEFDAGSALLVTAESDGEPVGFAFSSLKAADPIFATGPVGELDVLVVAPQRRGEGIGEALVRRSLELMRERGASTVKILVVAGNEGALRFYRRLGIDPARIELLAPARQLRRRTRRRALTARLVSPRGREPQGHPDRRDRRDRRLRRRAPRPCGVARPGTMGR